MRPLTIVFFVALISKRVASQGDQNCVPQSSMAVEANTGGSNMNVGMFGTENVTFTVSVTNLGYEKNGNLCQGRNASFRKAKSSVDVFLNCEAGHMCKTLFNGAGAVYSPLHVRAAKCEANMTCTCGETTRVSSGETKCEHATASRCTVASTAKSDCVRVEFRVNKKLDARSDFACDQASDVTRSEGSSSHKLVEINATVSVPMQARYGDSFFVWAGAEGVWLDDNCSALPTAPTSSSTIDYATPTSTTTITTTTTSSTKTTSTMTTSITTITTTSTSSITTTSTSTVTTTSTTTTVVVFCQGTCLNECPSECSFTTLSPACPLTPEFHSHHHDIPSHEHDEHEAGDDDSPTICPAVSELKEEVTLLKTEIRGMRELNNSCPTVSELKEEVAQLKSEITGMRELNNLLATNANMMAEFKRQDELLRQLFASQGRGLTVGDETAGVLESTAARLTGLHMTLALFVLAWISGALR